MFRGWKRRVGSLLHSQRGLLRRGGGAVANLQDEGQDGGAQRRVVAEFLQVTAVFPFGPDCHLDEAHQGEEGHRQALGHQCEAEPRAKLQG